MDYKQNFDKCWYKDVCDQQRCDSCIRFLEMSYLMDESLIPPKKQIPASLYPDEVDYDSFTTLSQYKTNIETFVRDGKNLYISSGITGNGKTSWAIKLLLKYFDSVWAGNGFRARGLFVHVPTLLLQSKDFQNPLSEEYKRKLLDCDLVVFDDIATADLSAYDYNNLLMYIDSRILNEKSNIFTSNRTTKVELGNVVGVRLASRIWETSVHIELKGKDKRNG